MQDREGRKERGKKESGERREAQRDKVWYDLVLVQRNIFHRQTFVIIICLLDVEQWLYSFSPQILEICKINKIGEFIISFYKFLEIVFFSMLFRNPFLLHILLRWASKSIYGTLIWMYWEKKAPWLLSFLNSLRILDSLPRLIK